MKTIYIFLFAAFGTFGNAQTTDKQNQQVQEIPKQSQEMFMKMSQDSQNYKASKMDPSKLASEQDLPENMKIKNTKSITPQKHSSGKLLPNTATLEEVLASIPGSRSQQNTNAENSLSKTKSERKLLPDTATLEEIKVNAPK